MCFECCVKYLTVGANNLGFGLSKEPELNIYLIVKSDEWRVLNGQFYGTVIVP